MRSRLSKDITRSERAKLHRKRVRALTARQRRREHSVAVQRQRVPGVDQLLHALQGIECAQTQLREAGDDLRAVLTIAPLAQAFAEFQRQGGVSASDWRRWLNGETPNGRMRPYYGKRHLRLISNQTEASITCGPINRRCNDDPDAA